MSLWGLGVSGARKASEAEASARITSRSLVFLSAFFGHDAGFNAVFVHVCCLLRKRKGKKREKEKKERVLAMPYPNTLARGEGKREGGK